MLTSGPGPDSWASRGRLLTVNSGLNKTGSWAPMIMIWFIMERGQVSLWQGEPLEGLSWERSIRRGRGLLEVVVCWLGALINQKTSRIRQTTNQTVNLAESRALHPCQLEMLVTFYEPGQQQVPTTTATWTATTAGPPSSARMTEEWPFGGIWLEAGAQREEKKKNNRSTWLCAAFHLIEPHDAGPVAISIIVLARRIKARSRLGHEALLIVHHAI